MQRADAEYMRAYRASNPHVRESNQAANAARRRGLTRLARLHPHDAERLINEERAAVGLPPLYSSKPGPKAAAC